MKKIVLNLAVTLDGFIEGPNGEVDWCILEDDMNFEGFLSDIDTIFYGRVSYDAWGNYLPASDASADETAVWNRIHAKQKYVFSRQQREYPHATLISDNIVEKVTAIKQQAGKDIWLYGGANLIKTFIQAGLIDVYKMYVHPVVLGAGKPLFEEVKERINLKLTGTRVFKSGVVELVYEPS
ncbi:dihydrofolate reductase family protein [Chitinophaga sp. Cy-1792]|uniref:dihydrofolate reductase family protein n=1 Tax=Chitinophaga sp. Cy-1792 TaxID=2608339 RepID=UPI00142024F5|nr:dihydrofolate reductase family protein [Chitinophaga sp. Cy-1792]NIG54681.1 dihydrofolate reductase [Chitinophaga sp. Cy-1792]